MEWHQGAVWHLSITALSWLVTTGAHCAGSIAPSLPGAALRCRPGSPPVQAGGRSRARRPGALRGTRTRNLWHLVPAPLPDWATSAWSLPSVPIRATQPYEGQADAGPEGGATGTGIEPVWPRSRALMGCQQPTRYQYGRRESDPHGPCGPAGFEPAVAAVTPLPQGCAARGSNPVPRIKSPVHHQSCLQRLEPPTGIEPAS